MQRRELKYSTYSKLHKPSALPLMQRRELKCRNFVLLFHNCCVASHAEAWIEIVLFAVIRYTESCCLSCRGVNWNNRKFIFTRYQGVASHAEAWIEIWLYPTFWLSHELPLMQRRELKLSTTTMLRLLRLVASHAEAWIEIWYVKTLKQARMLPLMQRRELKYYRVVHVHIFVRCLSCRGVNWNNHASEMCGGSDGLPLM